jgi:P-type E1-E2 ATPase
MAQRVIGDVPTARRLRDLPFDANRMRHSVLYAAAGGPVLYCRGAPEALLPECRRIHGGGGIEALDDSTRQTIVEAQEGMAERGLRVLAFALRRRVVADSEEALERDLTFLGLVGLEDPPRPEVPGAIRKCHDAGIKIVMVTGDHPRSAVAIAREIGLVRSADPTVLGGERLRRLSASDLARALCGGACSTGMRELAASAWRAEPCAR